MVRERIEVADDDERWEILWSRVDYDDDDLERCWEWQRATNKKGYGVLPWSLPGRTRIVHRYVYEEVNGVRLPKGKHVRHTCDNPPCCNPDHLVVGTPAENQVDMRERGRSKARHWGQGGSCVNGHLWDENEYFYGRKRVCRTCKAEEQRRRRAREGYPVVTHGEVEIS